MWGAIIGDIVGSRFEFANYRDKDFSLFDSNCRFTDDSVLTAAVAETLLSFDETPGEREFKDALIYAFHQYGKAYFNCGFGGRFFDWVIDRKREPYGSYGNGSAMRVSPVGWYASTLEEAERFAKWSAEVTHNHPEGIKGAVATAGAIFLARSGKMKPVIKHYVEGLGYALNVPVVRLQKTNDFDESCMATIPVAVRCFLEGEDFEDTIRNAISVGGDSDTIGAIAGSIAEAYFGVDEVYKVMAKRYLDERLKNTAEMFEKAYIHERG